MKRLILKDRKEISIENALKGIYHYCCIGLYNEKWVITEKNINDWVEISDEGVISTKNPRENQEILHCSVVVTDDFIEALKWLVDEKIEC